MDTEAVPELLGLDLSAAVAIIALLVGLQVLLVSRLRWLTARTHRAPAVPSAPTHASESVRAAPEVRAVSSRSVDDWNRLAHRSRISQLGEMSAAIAHEIRQPLTAIVFTGQAVRRQLANPATNPAELGEMLDDIVKAGEHAGEVIHRLQAMTRLEPVPFQEIDVNELVADTLRFFKGDLTHRNVQATLKLGTSLPKVRGDAVQLTQVLGNLIRNACDAMTLGSSPVRQIILSTEVSPSDGVRIAVRDSGPGLGESSPEKLFLPFQSAKPHGVGLGLAICRSIAEAHGGEISGANNQDGAGATFALTLPAVGSEWREELEINESPRDHLCNR